MEGEETGLVSSSVIELEQYIRCELTESYPNMCVFLTCVCGLTGTVSGLSALLN